ncbi:Endonuclease-reverse transcriptase, partial [Operophtera brumata]
MDCPQTIISVDKLPTSVENAFMPTKNEVEYLKRVKKNNNIIIFGVKEEEKSISDLIEKLKKNFQDDLSISIQDYEVNKIYRIGNTIKGDKPRPVLLSFVNGWKKSEVMKNKSYLKDLYVTEDYSKEVLEKRKALVPKLTEEINKGNIAYLKYDKLIVKEKKNNNNKDKRKREASTSPQTDIQPRKQHTLTTTKTNRKNAFDFMRGRSNSLSLYTQMVKNNSN